MEESNHSSTGSSRKRAADSNPYLMPLAVIVAGAFIAVAVYFGGGPGFSTKKDTQNNPNTQGTTEQPQTGDVEKLNPVTDSDHILGNRNAAVKIVEFSDLSCPFCKKFHPTMQQALKEYDGKVAWVYRHFPLDSIHPNAQKQAEASECANELGGSDAFWTYVGKLFDQQVVEASDLAKVAASVGLDKSAFQACLDSGKYTKHVKDDGQNALATGGQGTPWSIIVAPNGKKLPFSGAQPYSALKDAIDLALKEK